MKFINYILTALVATLIISCAEKTGEKKTLPNGYEYIVHKTDNNKPGMPGSYVEFDLDLINPEGEVLQSMRNSPQKPMMQIPKTEMDIERNKDNPLIALISIMGEGDSATVYMPMDSVRRPSPEMEGLSEIGYTLVCTRVISEDDYAAEQQAQQLESQKLAEAGIKEAEEKKVYCEAILKDYLAGKLTNDTKELEGGMKITILEAGKGDNPAVGSTVDVHYYGMLEDGTNFDNSYKRGKPFSFALGKGQVIKGWDVGIGAINKGSKALLDIPYQMAYGEAGSPPTIPAKARLFFYVSLEDFK